MSLGFALKVFFAALSNRKAAERLRQALEGEPVQHRLPDSRPETPAKPKLAEPTRSDALTLLSTLQREARFLDLVWEPLENFNDAQIGAAAREVLRDSKKTLDRIFIINPLAEAEEGSTVQLEENPSPTRYRLVGKSQGRSGTIAHRGWRATQCEVPTWNGSRDEAWILAPIEIDIQ